MKTKILTLALLLTTTFTFAQYCGHTGNPSGPSHCTPTGILTTSGFTPNEDIPCIIRGQSINLVIQFKNFDTLMVGGTLVTVNTLRFDSIGNLPSGLCWATNKSNNTFSNQEDGCIHISGVTYAQPGQYKLRLHAGIDVGLGFPITVDLDATGRKLYVRVVDQSFPFCPEVDTSQTSTTPVITYGNTFTNSAEVKGKLYFDVNQNQAFDVGEQPVSGQLVSIGNGYMAITNSIGNYLAYPLPGVIDITPQLSGNIATFLFNPDTITLSVDSGVSYPGNDFGILAPPGFCHGSINIIAHNPSPRPGFINSVTVRFNNEISATPVSETIWFSYDARQSFVSANPAPSTVDTSNHLVSWNISNINSGSSWSALVILRTPVSVSLGTVLNHSAWIVGTTCTSLEMLSVEEQVTVVGSCDPNDKAVSPVGEAPGGRILPDSKLNYTIRFQNTGTYLAENVNIIDTISNYLDISTLRVLAASHNYEVIIRGREATFRFSQINLPDSFSNEPLSHGYIKYSVETAAGFVQGSVVQNRADIYFDFNAPVLTNTTVNTADNFVGLTDFSPGERSVTVYPNPASGKLTVSSGNIPVEFIRITSISGRIITEVMRPEDNTVDISLLSPGIYIAEIKTREQTQRVKWVKM